MKQGLWCGFQRPDMLRTCDVASGKKDYFTAMADDFYEIQRDVFGDITDYYAVDPFHEGGQIGDLNLPMAYHRIQTKMLEHNPSAVWILQQWQGQITEQKICRLASPRQVLILDLQSDLRSYSELMERLEIPWIWCMLHNFGGRMGMVGDLETLSQEIPKSYQNSSFMAGIGITPEAFGHTPIVYEMLFDMAWTKEPADSAAYVKTYAGSRYGKADETMIHAWETLLHTVYGKKRTYTQGAMESVIYARPCEAFTSASTWGHSRYEYDKKELEPVLLDFLSVYEDYYFISTYRFDLVDVAKQLLATSANEIHKFMIQAYREKNLNDFRKWSKEFLDMIRLMDKVLSCCSEYNVGKWLSQARNMYEGMDDWTKDLFEFNARALITTWAGKTANNNGLQDYSNRQWSGVTGDYALVRWENFVERYEAALEKETAPEPVDYFLMEWEWANRKSDEDGDGYAESTSDCEAVSGTDHASAYDEDSASGGNLKTLVQEVYDRFSLTKLGIFTEMEDENIALHKPVTCTLDSVPGNSPESLTDNDITTVWKAARPGEVVFNVDLEGCYKISRIKFAMPPVAGDYAWDFFIHVYDGTNWVEIPAEQRETLLGTIEIPCKVTGYRVRYTFTPKSSAVTVPTAEFAELFVCGRHIEK